MIERESEVDGDGYRSVTLAEPHCDEPSCDGELKIFLETDGTTMRIHFSGLDFDGFDMSAAFARQLAVELTGFADSKERKS